MEDNSVDGSLVGPKKSFDYVVLKRIIESEEMCHPSPWFEQREDKSEWLVRDAVHDVLGSTKTGFRVTFDPEMVLAMVEHMETLETKVAELETKVAEQEELLTNVEGLAESWETWDDYARFNYGEKTEGPLYAQAVRRVLGSDNG